MDPRYKNYYYTFHDEVGKVFKTNQFYVKTPEEAKEKAVEYARKIHAHAFTRCKRNFKPI